MLALAAVGMPSEKCLCRRSGLRGAGLVSGVTPSISVMKAVVSGTLLKVLESKLMNLSTVSDVGEVSDWTLDGRSDDRVVTMLAGGVSFVFRVWLIVLIDGVSKVGLQPRNQR